MTRIRPAIEKWILVEWYYWPRVRLAVAFKEWKQSTPSCWSYIISIGRLSKSNIHVLDISPQARFV